MPTPPSSRQIQISQRGAIVRGVDIVMQTLQDLFPRRVFPKIDGDRSQILGDAWRRGGTSPGGASFSGPPDSPEFANVSTGNYFVGWANEKTDACEPQRIVWTPPDVGQERFLPPQSSGFMLDESADGSSATLRPATAQDMLQVQSMYQSQVGRPMADVGPRRLDGNPAQAIPGVNYGGGQRQMGAPFIAALVRTRVVPMAAHVWGNDWDDTEELVLWLSCAVETALQGTIAHANLPIIESGGWVRDQAATRGLHYVLVVNFACPVIWPPQTERRAMGFGVDVQIKPPLPGS